MLLIKHHEKQLSFRVLNLLADYARTMQHKQIRHWETDHEVDYFPYENSKNKSQAKIYGKCPSSSLID